MTAGIREYMDVADAGGSLARVCRTVSATYEAAAVTARAEGGPAILFEDMQGSSYRVVSNLVGTRERFALALGAKLGSIHDAILKAIDSPGEIRAGPAAFRDNSSSTLGDMPIITHFEKEPGPFITSSVVFAVNPQTGRQNTSFHRMMPIDQGRLTIRMVEGRHLHRCFVHAAEHGEDLRVAVVVGVHPAVLIAGAYQAGWGEEEMNVAASILGGGLEMAPLEWSGLRVPAAAEIVMEGRILQDQTHEEWMVEMLQTYDYRREQPVFQLERLYHRTSPIFHDILPGYGEHRLLMGMPVESKINGALRGAAPAVSASLSAGGCNWMHAVVRIKKERDTDVREIIRRTFEAHRSLKQVVVVDEDIDPDDAASVEYAMATRFQADRDVMIMRDVRGSSLDPSSDQKNLKTAKMGIDATMPLDKRPEGFQRARIPYMESVHLGEYTCHQGE